MAATLACTILLACIDARVELARQQKEAVAAIENLGGEVLYDYQLVKPSKPNAFDPKATLQVPHELRKRFGDDFFRVVVFVNLRDKKVTDDDLKILKKLPGLRNLDLTNTPITGAALEHLKGLSELAYLGLWRTRVDDEGLKHIKGLTKLWALMLDETKVTDAGLEHIAGLTNLEEWLGLSYTNVTDAGLVHLGGMRKLRQLTLRGTAVTPAGAKSIKMLLPNTDVAIGP